MIIKIILKIVLKINSKPLNTNLVALFQVNERLEMP